MAANYPEECDEREPDFSEHDKRLYLSGCMPGQEVIPECEIELEGYSLHERAENCSKNREHRNFIPVSEFNRDHLPLDLRCRDDIMELIHRRIDQTVRVRVPYTSLDRPNFFSDSKSEYPYRKYKGKKVVRYGTGSINRLLTPDPVKDRPCPCESCRTSGDPSTIHCVLTICTSTHVIFDNSEAERASFDCFFDSDESDPIYKLYGLKTDKALLTSNFMYQSDLCEVICVAHDADTIHKLYTQIFSGSFPNGVPRFMTPADPPSEIIISHPHGCSKQVTIGRTNHLMVPVKPVYELNTPNPLPNGTKCVLSRNHSVFSDLDISPITNSKDSVDEMLLKFKDLKFEISEGMEDATTCNDVSVSTENNSKTVSFSQVMSKLQQLMKKLCHGLLPDDAFQPFLETGGIDSDILANDALLNTLFNNAFGSGDKEGNDITRDGGILAIFDKLADNLLRHLEISQGQESEAELELARLDAEFEECATVLRQSSFFRGMEEIMSNLIMGMGRMLPTYIDDVSLSEEDRVQRACSNMHKELVTDLLGNYPDFESMQRHLSVESFVGPLVSEIQKKILKIKMWKLIQAQKLSRMTMSSKQKRKF